MKVNVTLPVYNEEAQLGTNVRRVIEFLRTQGWDSELVIADNGSRDGTLEIARGLEQRASSEAPSTLMSDERSETEGRGQKPDDRGGRTESGEPRNKGEEQRGKTNVRVVHLDLAGRGRALKTAWLASEAEVLSYMDVDLSTELTHLPALIEAISRGQCDVAIGSRLLPESKTTRGWKRELLSRGYNWLLRLALGLRVHDAQCGFKALSRAAARALLPQVRDIGFFFDTELLVLAQRQGYCIAELPVRWVDDPDSRVRLARTIWEDLKGVWRLRRR